MLIEYVGKTWVNLPESEPHKRRLHCEPGQTAGGHFPGRDQFPAHIQHGHEGYVGGQANKTHKCALSEVAIVS